VKIDRCGSYLGKTIDDDLFDNQQLLALMKTYKVARAGDAAHTKKQFHHEDRALSTLVWFLIMDFHMKSARNGRKNTKCQSAES